MTNKDIPPEVLEARDRTIREGKVVRMSLKETCQHCLKNRLLIAMYKNKTDRKQLADQLDMKPDELMSHLVLGESIPVLQQIAAAIPVDISDLKDLIKQVTDHE